VRSHIYRIRRKIKQATDRKGVIRTVRGVGYALDEEYA
jgi:DNA-binding response OmpR family regulator